jgi:hypothetical protein
MDIIRFDRHSNMNETTTSEILKLTTEVMVEDGSQSLINSLYGLFDGYFYTDILQNTEGLSPETIARINKVVDVVKTYPAI